MAKLSGVHDSQAAGLPRGSHSLTPAEAREAQRRRLIRAAISVFSERGYAAATIADIVAGARVSRVVFYDLFDSKEACFLAAETLGREAIFHSMASAMLGADQTLDQWLRATVRNYLNICAEEPEFTRAWTIEFPNASPATLQRRNAYFSELASRLKAMHQIAQRQAPDVWANVPESFYNAAIGGAHELIFELVSQRRYQDLPALEEPIVEFVCKLLGH